MGNHTIYIVYRPISWQLMYIYRAINCTFLQIELVMFFFTPRGSPYDLLCNWKWRHTESGFVHLLTSLHSLSTKPVILHGNTLLFYTKESFFHSAKYMCSFIIIINLSSLLCGINSLISTPSEKIHWMNVEISDQMDSSGKPALILLFVNGKASMCVYSYPQWYRSNWPVYHPHWILG